MGKRKKSKVPCDKIKCWLVLGAVATMFMAICFPFVLDYCYRKGMLSWWNNKFSADTWFSFIGSYFPATIVGILSLYQAYIIQHQEKRYKKLLYRYCLIPAGHAKVYRYNEKKNLIGNYSLYDIEQMFKQYDKDSSLENWTLGYVIESEVYNSTGRQIIKSDVKRIEWEVNRQKYCQDISQRMISSVRRISHSHQQIVVYWLFNEDTDINDIIYQCMNNLPRHDIRYEITMITITLQITDFEDKNYDLNIQLMMKAQEDSYQMSSFDEYYVSEVK